MGDATPPNYQAWVAAAEAIALLFEKSWRKATPADTDDLREHVDTGELYKVVQKYSPYRNPDQIVAQLDSIYKKGRKSGAIKKSDRIALNDTIVDVMQTIEEPDYWQPASTTMHRFR